MSIGEEHAPEPVEVGDHARPRHSRHTGRFATDEQTGVRYEIVLEDAAAHKAAVIAAIYLICMLAFLLWLLLDTWAGRDSLLSNMGYAPKTLASPTFRLIAYVVLAGAIGATVDGLRSIVAWHSELKAYGKEFLWKDLSLPLTGAAVALIIYALLRGGAGLLSGDFSLGASGSKGTSSLTGFAVGALSGFSARQVFRWLDAEANKLFKVGKADQAATPDLSGKTLAEAHKALKDHNLALGKAAHEADPAHLGRVIRQSPAAGAIVKIGEAVDLTLGAPANGGSH